MDRAWDTEQGNARRDKRWIRVLFFFLENKSLVLLLILIVTAQFITDGLFFTVDNLSSVLRQISVFTIMALGFTLLFAVQSLDLSIGTMLSLISCLYAWCSLHMPLSVAMLVALVAGLCFGFFNGAFSEMFSLPPFLVTLATAQIFRGVANLLAKGKSINGLRGDIRFLAQANIFRVIPLTVLLIAVMAALLAVMLHSTRMGRHLIAVGGNPQAALSCGISVRRTKIYAYMLSGFCVAIGALVLTGRVSMATPSAGERMEVDVIAAVAVGGTPMSGGKARLGGTLLGCLVVGILINLLNLSSISPFWQGICKGGTILLAILIDSHIERYTRATSQFSLYWGESQ